MTESLHSSLETITTLFVNQLYTELKSKKFKNYLKIMEETALGDGV